VSQFWKLYDDLHERNDNDKMVARWCEILEFWNGMSTAEQYKEVNKGPDLQREDPSSAGGKEGQLLNFFPLMKKLPLLT